MASYHNLLQPTKQQFESPAKVFAKLKSKVQREAMCGKEGVFPDPPCYIRDEHGADFNSPRKRADIWMDGELKENYRCGSYRDEVQAVTISPISSPQKTVGYRGSFSDTGRKHVDQMTSVTETGHSFISRHGHTLTKRAFLESTAVSSPISKVNREQILKEATQIRGLDGFRVNRTPVKNDCVRSVFEEECAPQDKLTSPATMYSPMRKRLRKRKLDQGLSKVSVGTKEINAEVGSHSHQRKPSPVLRDHDTHDDSSMENLCGVRGFTPGRSQMNQFTHELMLASPRSIAEKRSSVIMEKLPLMSPAKMLAFMKERESKREQQEVCEVISSTRKLFNRGEFTQSRDTPLSTAHNMGEREDMHFQSVPEVIVPVKRSRVETTDSHSHPSVHVMVPAEQSQAVLLEDPLVVNSPCVSIPKKHQAMFKRNKLPQCEKFPNESVIYLKRWFLRKTHKGLFVDGIHREENIPWNSNVIVDRVSNYVVKTVSGRVYILVGKMKLDAASGFPMWFLKNFVNGFPPNWKVLYETFLSESRDTESEKNSDGGNRKARKKSDASSLDVSVKPQRQKPFKTPASCPPASSTKVSRSGRTIKPPLEYWKGGRVILDAQMNVTIHECYDTSLCIPEVTTTVSSRKSQKPTHVFLPCSEGRKQCESASEEEVSVPLRKVKAPLRKRSQAKIDPVERSSYPLESTNQTVSSPEEFSHRVTRSSQRCPATERMLHLDTVPQKRSRSTSRSKKQTHDTNRPSVRGRKQAVLTSPESLTFSDDNLPQQSSSDEHFTRRKTQRKGELRKRGGKVLNERQLNHSSLSGQSSEISGESGKKLKKTERRKNSDAAQSQRKSHKKSPPTRPSSKSTQSSKKHKTNRSSAVVPQEQDEDEWTEAELMKLQEAVSHYPKHMTGYWAKVARMVGTRSAAECHHQHTSQGRSQTPAKKAKTSRKEKAEAPKEPATDHPVITARAGTFKRKKQVRQFLEAMPKEDVEDIFSSAYMQNKRFEMPSMCPSDDHDFAMSDLEPLTPMSKMFPDVKTPQCLHITPGMMGSPNRSNDDKYVYQLQKRMKKNQFNVYKQAPSSKSFTPTPSVKRTMKRCGNTENDTFVVWEMFPGNDGAVSESGEEEDFYFSDND